MNASSRQGTKPFSLPAPIFMRLSRENCQSVAATAIDDYLKDGVW